MAYILRLGEAKNLWTLYDFLYKPLCYSLKSKLGSENCQSLINKNLIKFHKCD